jgi:hypothetical protein
MKFKLYGSENNSKPNTKIIFFLFISIILIILIIRYHFHNFNLINHNLREIISIFCLSVPVFFNLFINILFVWDTYNGIFNRG